ncbi:hypothetical protein ACFYM3_17110 [Streptomyces massasporeus]|uniref:Uncharacterized protein n=1 Tax=Streptomyces massasporeus TaxID=67324 RepID=A0ABW6LD08_9ACTN
MPVLKDGIRLRRLSRWRTERLGEDMAVLAVASAAGTPRCGIHDRGEFLRRPAVSARRPGFALLLAETTVLVAETTVLVGCAYGLFHT